MLYERLVKGGTLSQPKGVPDPAFALQSTVSWMAALALLSRDITFSLASTFYASVSSRAFLPPEENTIFAQLVFAAHQVSAIRALNFSPRKADVARVGIVTWYYGVYSAAQAMVTAQSGACPDNHGSAANAWDRQIAAQRLAMRPFEMRLSTIEERPAAAEVTSLRGSSPGDLNSLPHTAAHALGACCAYLSGSAAWYREKTQHSLRKDREFKALHVSDFRTKKARELRDSHFAGKSVGFLHQAYRYRGKANYREALFLGCGSSVEVLVRDHVTNLDSVLTAFVTMAGAFVSRRLGAKLWDEFVSDLERTKAFTFSPRSIWPTIENVPLAS